MHRDLTPPTMFAGNTISGFNMFTAFRTFRLAIALDPMMQKWRNLTFSLRLRICLYAVVGRRALHTSLVYDIFTEYARQTLLSHAAQQIQAQIAICRAVEMFQSPQVISIVAHILCVNTPIVV